MNILVYDTGYTYISTSTGGGGANRWHQKLVLEDKTFRLKELVDTLKQYTRNETYRKQSTS